MSFINFNNREELNQNSYTKRMIQEALYRVETKNKSRIEKLTEGLDRFTPLNEALLLFNDKFNAMSTLSHTKVEFGGTLNEGQFSWFTQDSGEQIGSERENTIDVWMYDNQGNVWYEKNYEGYGEFGGMDYYELVATMNGYTEEDLEDYKGSFKELRQLGIDLAFGNLKTKDKKKKTLFPALVADPRYNWKRHDFTKEAESDPNQSWYVEYDDEEEDEYYYEAKEVKFAKTVTKKEWDKAPKDYKTVIDGVHYMLVNGGDMGTVLAPVEISEAEINEAKGDQITIHWAGLKVGKEGTIGTFIVSPKVHSQLEDEFGREISIDFYDENVKGKLSSYDDVIDAMRNSEYGKIAMAGAADESVVNEKDDAGTHLDALADLVGNARDFFAIGKELDKSSYKGKYFYSDTMMPMYQVEIDGFKFGIINKKYVDKGDREVGSTAIGIMEDEMFVSMDSITEANWGTYSTPEGKQADKKLDKAFAKFKAAVSKAHATYRDEIKGLSSSDLGNKSGFNDSEGGMAVAGYLQHFIKSEFMMSDFGDISRFDYMDGMYEGKIIEEGRSIGKIQKEWAAVTLDMKQTVEEWKAAEGDRKSELLDKLKALTSQKKSLEKELDDAVGLKDADAELVGEAKKYKSDDIIDAWESAYGEDILQSDHMDVIDDIENDYRGKVTVKDLEEIFDDRYGEELDQDFLFALGESKSTKPSWDSLSESLGLKKKLES